jgi:hypothetical protein
MKRLFMLVPVILIMYCASSGQIVGTRFIDRTYDFEIKFPMEYRLMAHGAKSVKRVQAIKWQNDPSIRMKPTYVISIVDSGSIFVDAVAKEKDKHFEPRYYLSCEAEKEEVTVVNGRDAYFIYYKGVGVKAVTAFINFDDYVMKIEYIVEADFYNKDEFMGILKNIVTARGAGK